MEIKSLPRPLQIYILLHVLALLPVAWIVSQLPGENHPSLVAALLLTTAVVGIWRIELTLKSGGLSLVFTVACLAFLLQGAQTAVLCASLGALLTHLIRPADRWWRLRFSIQPLHRRVFNLTHCALACALAALIEGAVRPLAAEGWLRELSSLLVFTSAYFLLNTFGVATAIALEQGEAPFAVWKEHCFWMAPVYFLSASVAGGIAVAFQTTGMTALLLLPCFYLVFIAYRTYISTLRKQKELLAEVNRLYAQEEEANRRKDEFLAALAHELRNPLAAIANAHYLLAHGSSEVQAQRSVDTIGRQTRHLQRMVEDLLDVSRITRGVIELRKELTDLRQPLESALEAVQPLLQVKHHTLRLTLPSQPVYAEVDPDRVEQIFVNLLGNAAKYTEPHGEIVVLLSDDPDEVTFTVRDNGLGIHAEHLPRIFDLFIQEKRSLASSEGGLGIGLTLVKRLVDLHNGQLEAQSEGPNRGSQFTVRLARAAVERVEPQDPGIDEAAQPPARAGRARLLLAEDQEDAADALLEILELWGYSVILARDGQEALALARTQHFDVCILDVGLPGMDGYTLARRLRTDGCGATLIAVTGYGQPQDRDAALQAGFDYHRVKPIDVDELGELLNAVTTCQVCPKSGQSSSSTQPA